MMVPKRCAKSWCALCAVGAGQAELSLEQASAALSNSGDSTLKFEAREAAAVASVCAATVRELPRPGVARLV